MTREIRTVSSPVEVRHEQDGSVVLAWTENGQRESVRATSQRAALHAALRHAHTSEVRSALREALMGNADGIERRAV